jgi:undecaprenyl-phosphate 4-deoxy-4-formamido-L-arabinose transferase
VHEKRKAGSSGYTLRRLIRLWLSAWINFSILPLRVATVLGIVMGMLGVVGFIWVVWLRVTQRGPAFGWGSLMAALMVFGGAQLVLLGIIGEYIGRMFLSVNQRPQAVVREVLKSGT